MERFLLRSSSLTSLGGQKRPREEAAGEWQAPKRPWRAGTLTSKEPIGISNRFSGLSDDDSERPSSHVQEDSAKRKPRIPPIIVDLGTALSHRGIQEAVARYTTDYHLQYRGKNKVAVLCYDGKCHQRVKEGFLKDNIPYHTFTRREEKLPKAVVRGLPSLPTDEISEDLASLGFKDCKVVVLKPRATATEQYYNPLYLIQLPAGADMARFRRLRFICRCAVEIRKFKPKNWEGTQCFRCQGFGHASSNCNLSPRCVKCLDPHATKDCPKSDRNTPAQCCNCREAHPANYRQCPARKTYIDRIRSQTQVKTAVTQMPLPNQTKTQYNKPGALTPTWATMTAGATQSKPVYANISSERCPENLGLDKGNCDATSEMLEILKIIKSLKKQFLTCESMVDKVLLILSHLGQYV